MKGRRKQKLSQDDKAKLARELAGQAFELKPLMDSRCKVPLHTASWTLAELR